MAYSYCKPIIIWFLDFEGDGGAFPSNPWLHNRKFICRIFDCSYCILINQFNISMFEFFSKLKS
jgi:hypothetical protein